MVKSGGTKKRKGDTPTFEKKVHGPNLFERMSNKKRFDVLGKKVKGETRHTGRLRTAAVEKVSGGGGSGGQGLAAGSLPARTLPQHPR